MCCVVLGLGRGETQQAGQVVKPGPVPVLLEASHPLGDLLLQDGGGRGCVRILQEEGEVYWHLPSKSGIFNSGFLDALASH